MKFIPNSVSRKVGEAVLKGQKNSPTILFVAGVVGVGATVVTACRATLRLEEVLEETQRDLDDVTKLQNGEHPEFVNGRPDTYTDADVKHDTTLIYTKGVVKIVKLYAPSVALGVISIACLTQSHRILTRRNAALTAAYTVIERSFNDYRNRVREELGEQKDEEFYYGVSTDKVVERTESGQKTKTSKSAAGPSRYGRIFDETNKCWQPTPSWNRSFLEAQQENATLRLRERGWLTLNDVLKSLGFEETREGMVVGWVYSNPDGDGYVDFGMGDWPTPEDWTFGREQAVVLDFNVDGLIFDKVRA